MAIEWSDDIVLSELSDEPMLSEELNAIADRLASLEPDTTPHVVLNLGRVSYLNSSNLAQLLRIRKLLAAAGRILKLCAVTDEVWSVMMVTGLDKVFRFAPDPMTALAGIQLEDEAREG
ncbi:MAG: STAS domain-containing protein [Phycisphaeraceae bacterium]|nr:STAS domain-containing protein [Phycisphaeraceae bacterium]QYK48373.1 MAG: STAS domain-containing protein [Phycisphaeraceae bacterium]